MEQQTKKLILIGLVFITISCNHLEEGVVVTKHYEPTHSYTMFMPMRVGKTTILIPYIVTDFEDYVVTIEGEYDGEMTHEEVYVTKECYDQLQSGSIWHKTDQCSFSDPNNQKIRK